MEEKAEQEFQGGIIPKSKKRLIMVRTHVINPKGFGICEYDLVEVETEEK